MLLKGFSLRIEEYRLISLQSALGQATICHRMFRADWTEL
jgi:hypothetical protein